MTELRVTAADLPRGTLLGAAIRSPSFVAGALIALLFIGLAVVSFVWTPYPCALQNLPNKLKGLTAEHWFGTDQYGRDVFSMILVGARTSIAVALIAVGVGVGIGVPLGLTAAAQRAISSTTSSCAATIWCLRSRRC